MEEIVIRNMELCDLDEVVVIECASFSTPWKLEHFKHEIDAMHSYPLVAVCGNKILGYLCLMSLFEEAQVLDIAVDPSKRGRCVAQRLLEYAENLALTKGATYICLEVRQSNVAARNLYHKNGYLETGTRPRYYESTEDAILMEKQLGLHLNQNL